MELFFNLYKIPSDFLMIIISIYLLLLILLYHSLFHKLHEMILLLSLKTRHENIN